MMRTVLYSPILTSILVLAVVPGVLHSPCALAQDGDRWEGAVWTYEMKSVKSGGGARNGAFRVNGKDLFQPNPTPKTPKIVGRKEPVAGGKTRLHFTDLSANRGKVRGIKGQALITLDRFGEWSGRFIDSEGTHWEFKCKRSQE